MIGTKIQLHNFDSGVEITLNDHETDDQNVIALQVLPTFESDVRGQNIPRQGAHGEFRLPYYYSGMSIVLQGVIVGEDEAHVWSIKSLFDKVMSLTPNAGFAKEQESVRDQDPYARNLCTNPRGEFLTTDWTGTNATLTAVDGIKAVAGSSSEASVRMDTAAVAGQVAHAALDITNSQGTSRPYQLVVQALDGSNSVIATSTPDSHTLAGGELRRFHVSLLLPATTAKFRVVVRRLVGGGAATSDEFHIDRAIFLLDPATIFDPASFYFDGNTPDLIRSEFDWDGDAGLSASRAYKLSFPSMYRNTVRISFTNPNGKRMFVDATPLKPVSYDRPLMQTFRLNFQVILRANFPVLVNDEDIPQFFLGGFGSQEQGFKVPFESPFSLSTEFIDEPITVNVDEACLASIKLFGSDNGTIINPRITNTRNGNTMRIVRSLKGSNRYFAIDGIYQSVKDENGNDATAYVDGGFILLEAGENILVYTADYAIPN